ncbi:MAG: hypothetical protein ACJA0Q_001190 [Saprospiraceae bacterium]|jgi:hypothetical protein
MRIAVLIITLLICDYSAAEKASVVNLFNINSLTNGRYFLKIVFDGKVHHESIFIEH